MVTGCAWGNRGMPLDVYNKVNFVQGQEDSSKSCDVCQNRSCDA